MENPTQPIKSFYLHGFESLLFKQNGSHHVKKTLPENGSEYSTYIELIENLMYKVIFHRALWLLEGNGAIL